MRLFLVFLYCGVVHYSCELHNSLSQQQTPLDEVPWDYNRAGYVPSYNEDSTLFHP